MKVKTVKSLLNPKTTLHKIVLSGHAQTLEADILHPQEKATKPLTDMYKINGVLDCNSSLKPGSDQKLHVILNYLQRRLLMMTPHHENKRSGHTRNY